MKKARPTKKFAHFNTKITIIKRIIISHKKNVIVENDLIKMSMIQTIFSLKKLFIVTKKKVF